MTAAEHSAHSPAYRSSGTDGLSMLRLFFGVEVSVSACQRLASVQTRLRQAGVTAGKWADPANFHITVLFLGETPANIIPQLTSAAARATARVKPFSLTLAKIGAFERGRILWVGVGNDSGLHQLERLHQALFAETAEAVGARVDGRPYRPHLTLARKLDVFSLQAARKAQEPLSELPAAFSVHAITLFESTRFGGQLTYSARHRNPLG